MWAYDLGYEVIWRIGFTDTSYGGALGTVFLNFNKDYTYFYPDYVPGQAALDLYDDADLRYSGYFYQTETGYAHGLSWPLLVKYYGNRNLIANQIYHVSMPKPFRLAEQYLIRAEAYCQKNDFFEGRQRPLDAAQDALQIGRYDQRHGRTTGCRPSPTSACASSTWRVSACTTSNAGTRASSVSRRPIPRPKAARSRSKPTTRFSYGRSRSTS